MEAGKGSMAVPALVVTTLLGGLEIAAAKDPPPPSGLTARQIIERIQDHTGGHDREPWQGPTVDTIKAGDPDTAITGIATTFTATMDVLERAAARKTNLVIAHEPTFYNHLDETAWLGDDPVLQAKLAYVKEHHLVIWRFHDHLHRAPGQPDRILKGMVAALGWSAFQNAEEPYRFRLPETTLSDLAGQIKRRLGIRTLRVVGDPRLQVSQVAFLPGAAGRERQVKALQSAAVQVLVVVAASSLLFFLALYVGLPALRQAGVSWFATFNLVLALPLGLLGAAALVDCRLEGYGLSWPALRDRLRLGRPDTSTWLWTVALS